MSNKDAAVWVQAGWQNKVEQKTNESSVKVDDQLTPDILASDKSAK